jgi:hypothetical protein
MANKKVWDKIGAIAFLVGVLLAIIIGLFSFKMNIAAQATAAWFLVILGVIVGFLNVKDKEVSTFLLAGVALVIVSAMGSGQLLIVPAVANILGAMLILFVPATIIVALKTVFSVSRN